MENKEVQVVVLRHRHSDLMMAISPDMKGLNVAARTDEEIERLVPLALRDLLEAQGYEVESVRMVPQMEVDSDEFSNPLYRANAEMRSAA